MATRLAEQRRSDRKLPEAFVVNAAGAVQGIVLVTAPAASTVFTDPAEYGLSSTQYGTMFVPQVVTAIGASVLGGRLGRRSGTKSVYLAGLVCGLLAMSLLVVSQFFTTDRPVAYGLLLLATASLGAGFGLTVPALNSLTASLHPRAVDSAVLVLNALLGLGTALAPVFVAAFVGLGFWWGLPVMSAVLLAALIAVSVRLPLNTGPRVAGPTPVRLPRRFWLYVAFAILYGACETVNGNWTQLDMVGDVGASATVASLALTAFWAMVTAGRVLFAALRRVVPPAWTFHVLPFVLAGAFVLIASLPTGQPALGVAAFGLAGLGCSALLPLTIGLGQTEFTAQSGSVAGGVIAAYQLGYGIAAFGVGPLHASGVGLSTIYGGAAIVAAAMGALAFPVARRSRAP